MNAPSFAPPNDFSTWPQERKDTWFADTAKAYDEARERAGLKPPDAVPRYVPAYQKGLKILDGAELLKTEFPPRSLMMAPWLPDKGLAVIFAARGVGKTWIALSIAHAVAAGGGFLRWRAPRPRRVLYLDGEMPAVTLHERYAAVIAASMTDAPGENFRLVAADFQPDGLPDLADTEAQRFYDPAIADAELIIVDNLSTIARGLRVCPETLCGIA